MKNIIAAVASFFLIGVASAQTSGPSGGPTETSGSQNYGADKVAFVGGLAGYGTANNDFNGFTWGATVGSKLVDNFGWDVYFSSTQKDFGAGVETKVMPIVADLNYFMSGPIGFYIGPRVGVAITTADTPLGDNSNTDFALGAQIGTDFHLAEAFSVGVNVNWTHSFADLTDLDLFNFVVPVKVWF